MKLTKEGEEMNCICGTPISIDDIELLQDIATELSFECSSCGMVTENASWTELTKEDNEGEIIELIYDNIPKHF